MEEEKAIEKEKEGKKGQSKPILSKQKCIKSKKGIKFFLNQK